MFNKVTPPWNVSTMWRSLKADRESPTDRRVNSRTDLDARPCVAYHTLWEKNLNETQPSFSGVFLGDYFVGVRQAANNFSQETNKNENGERKKEKRRKHVQITRLCAIHQARLITQPTLLLCSCFSSYPDGWHLVVHGVPWPLMLCDRLLTFQTQPTENTSHGLAKIENEQTLKGWHFT